MTTHRREPAWRSDDGIVIVWALALVSLLLLCGVVGAVVVGQADLRMRAASVADLAALAGAQSTGDACAAAGAVVAANGLLLTECSRDGPDVVVTVVAETPGERRHFVALLGGESLTVTATSRAGPP